ncbi:hypothetical protein VUR80DRAFT_3590 [Thermomyces stellatus]
MLGNEILAVKNATGPRQSMHVQTAHGKVAALGGPIMVASRGSIANHQPVNRPFYPIVGYTSGRPVVPQFPHLRPGTAVAQPTFAPPGCRDMPQRGGMGGGRGSLNARTPHLNMAGVQTIIFPDGGGPPRLGPRRVYECSHSSTAPPQSATARPIGEGGFKPFSRDELGAAGTTIQGSKRYTPFRSMAPDSYSCGRGPGFPYHPLRRSDFHGSLKLAPHQQAPQRPALPPSANAK